jgi:hypothetical protein
VWGQQYTNPSSRGKTHPKNENGDGKMMVVGVVWHIEFVGWVCWVCVCASLATAVRCGNVMWGNVVGLDIYVR